MERFDKRENDQLRNVEIEQDFIKSADGSVLISVGDTKVIITAMVDDKVPPFLRGQGKGWISAEYNMLPGSTITRKQRDGGKGADGRSVEIQRLIGRALRSVIDLEKLGERTIWIDCDVIQADGGTRTASITGAYVALKKAIDRLLESGQLEENPLTRQVAAVSVGIPAELNEPVLDLNYNEDKGAMVDMNVVMTDQGELIEVQATGEERPFSQDELNQLMNLAQKGIKELVEIQKKSSTKDKQDIILATHNKHKVKEVSELLGDDFNVLTMEEANIMDEPVEDGKTIQENADIKTEFLRDKLGSEHKAILLGDDTGLFVEALDGAPGVYSARYSGDEATYESNNKKLLEELKDQTNRNAEFKTSISIIFPDGTKKNVTSNVEGVIAEEPEGTEGFGYDPLFIENSTGKTYATMTLEEKNEVSHRGKAIELAKEEINKWIEEND